MPENGVAKPEDFRNLALENAFEEPERVVLPGSGLAVILRRPRLIFYTLMAAPQPVEIQRRITEAGSLAAAKLSSEELVEYSNWITEVLKSIFVDPGLSLAPGPREIHPNWLQPGDIEFIFSWMVGGVLLNADPARFPGVRGESAAAVGGAGGGGVPLPPVPDATGDDGGMATGSGGGGSSLEMES